MNAENQKQNENPMTDTQTPNGILPTASNILNIVKQKKFVIVGAIVLIAIMLISIFANSHICDNCEKRYVGKEYHVQGIFDDYSLCKKCYKDYYSWD